MTSTISKRHPRDPAEQRKERQRFRNCRK
ncbi:BgTH12-03783 [Blumeria graminis f. sp. triticale]|uniref:BgTH12-03783 n=1 Tax=Blumeria graminis f. sp. triticale TaxID=1689686 RepID=A0A9W4CVT3_BLUGR|nr:BgTH12-03783 [Blumeria graminis f. sp. triticale]